MNLKLTNEEERRRNGRYVAVLVGICLFLLAMYHAWVRRIPVVASLVVPALIMFVYVGWVLFTASRDKRRLLDAEAALNAINQENEENESHTLEISRSNIDISESSKESSKINSPDDWSEISSVFQKGAMKTEEKSVCFIKPIILVNDKLPEDLDQKWTNLVQTIITSEKQKEYPRRKFKRKFCRSRRNAALKRSYSIGSNDCNLRYYLLLSSAFVVLRLLHVMSLLLREVDLGKRQYGEYKKVVIISDL